jgi:hypothetical protein
MALRYILQRRSKFKALGMQAVAKIKVTNCLLGLVGKLARSLARSLLLLDEDSEDEDGGRLRCGSLRRNDAGPKGRLLGIEMWSLEEWCRRLQQ